MGSASNSPLAVLSKSVLPLRYSVRIELRHASCAKRHGSAESNPPNLPRRCRAPPRTAARDAGGWWWMTTAAPVVLAAPATGWLALPRLNLLAPLAMTRRDRCFRALQSASLSERCGHQDSQKRPSRPLPRWQLPKGRCVPRATPGNSSVSSP